MSSPCSRSSYASQVAISAISVLLMFAIYRSDLTPRSRQSFPSLVWSSGLRPCNNRPCLDLPDGLRILDAHVRHVTGIWDLVEGLGYPGMQTFTPARRRLPFGSYPLGPLQDDASHAFMNRMKRFTSKGDLMDAALAWDVLSSAVFSFQDIALAMSDTQKVISQMEDAQFQRTSSSTNNNPASMTANDLVLNATLVSLVETIVAECDTTVRNINKVLPKAANASSAGNEVAFGWSAERARVKDALSATPWWEVLTLAHWAGVSDRTLYKQYSKFLEEQEGPFRSLAEAASAINDNLVNAKDYCLWYSNRDVGFKWASPMFSELASRRYACSMKTPSKTKEQNRSPSKAFLRILYISLTVLKSPMGLFYMVSLAGPRDASVPSLRRGYDGISIPLCCPYC
ncbi:hypothetical protein DFH06DRAFT_1306147 [Mycena polygramma]|nr:hypothetical protein DFH06DRAFT_1306147 [Mycena polygramma]